jgi:hypothetical protein
VVVRTQILCTFRDLQIRKPLRDLREDRKLGPPAFNLRRNTREFDTKFDSPAFYTKSRRLPNN